MVEENFEALQIDLIFILSDKNNFTMIDFYFNLPEETVRTPSW